MDANLVLLNRNGSHKTFALTHPVTVLGRRHDCNLRIPLPMVSRRHCQLSVNGELMKLRDLGSHAGTFVNGKQVEAEKDVPIKAGDYIGIGPLTFVCQIDGRPAKIVPPEKSAPKAKPQKKPAPAVPPKDIAAELDREAEDDLDRELSQELDDLDVSDSFINLDELDSDLDDLKDA